MKKIKISTGNIQYSYEQLVAYKDMPKGQCFYRVDCQEFGIKLSPYRFFSFNWNRVFGFADNKPNNSDTKRYLPVDISFRTEERTCYEDLN